MGNYVGSAKTVCPYYRYEKNYTICCEGMAERSTIITQFDQTEVKRQWQEQYCFRLTYGSCPIAKTVNKRYTEGT